MWVWVFFPLPRKTFFFFFLNKKATSSWDRETRAQIVTSQESKTTLSFHGSEVTRLMRLVIFTYTISKRNLLMHHDVPVLGGCASQGEGRLSDNACNVDSSVLRTFTSFNRFSLSLFLAAMPVHACKHPRACEILVPQPGTEPCSLQWKCGFLTTGPWGKFLLTVS